MTDCTAAFMATGYGQAFVFEKAAMKMYAIDAIELLHSIHGEVTATARTDFTTSLIVSTTDLTFMPNSAAVSGAPVGYACVAEEHHDHSAPAAAPTASGDDAPTTPENSAPVASRSNSDESFASHVGAGMFVLALCVVAMNI